MQGAQGEDLDLDLEAGSSGGRSGSGSGCRELGGGDLDLDAGSSRDSSRTPGNWTLGKMDSDLDLDPPDDGIIAARYTCE